MVSGDAIQFNGHQTKPTLLLKGHSVFTDCLLLLLNQQMSELCHISQFYCTYPFKRSTFFPILQLYSQFTPQEGLSYLGCSGD